MSGDTHEAVAFAAASFLLPSIPTEELPLTVAAIGLGAILPDVDQTNQRTKKMVACAVAVVVTIMMADVTTTKMLGALALAIWVVIGYTRPHREMTHSLIMAMIPVGAVYAMVGKVAIPFAVAMISHDLIDTLNKKPVKLLWPIPLKVKFSVGKADGWLNTVTRWCALAVVAVNIVLWVV